MLLHIHLNPEYYGRADTVRGNFPHHEGDEIESINYKAELITVSIHANELSDIQTTWLEKAQNKERYILSYETIDEPVVEHLVAPPELHILDETEDSLTIRLSQNFDYAPRMTIAVYGGTQVKISNMVSERHSDAYHISLDEEAVLLLQSGFDYWNKKLKAMGLDNLDEHPF